MHTLFLERASVAAAATYNRHGSAHCEEEIGRNEETSVEEEEMCVFFFPCKQSFVMARDRKGVFLRSSHSFALQLLPFFARTKGAPPFSFLSLPLEAPGRRSLPTSSAAQLLQTATRAGSAQRASALISLSLSLSLSLPLLHSSFCSAIKLLNDRLLQTLLLTAGSSLFFHRL